jgi:hypothetical protein
MSPKATTTYADKNLRRMNEQLWTAAKAKAMGEGKDMRELVEQLLRQYLKGQ